MIFAKENKTKTVRYTDRNLEAPKYIILHAISKKGKIFNLKACVGLSTSDP